MKGPIGHSEAMLPLLIAISTLFTAPESSLSARTPVMDGSRLDCFDETFCLETVAAGDSILVQLQNLVAWDVTVEVGMDLSNLQSSEPLPLVQSFPGKSTTRVLSLGILEQGQGWSLEFDLKWTTGSMDAHHSPGYAYTLPYAKGSEYLVGQGFNGPSTHQGRNAIDWDMPEGTEVLAARGGVVIEVEESYRRGGLDPSLKSMANFVKIRHEDGTIGNYVHLRQLGVRVRTGDVIRTGELIAYSGNTGFTSGPHLHFEVYTLTRDLERNTIPIQFTSAGRAAEILQEGNYYRN